MEAIWPGSSSFAAGETPYGFYDSDTAFSGSGNHNVDKFADWAAKRLGYPITDIELQGDQMYACFEESVTEYSALVNQYNIKENISSLQGAPTSSNFTHTVVSDLGRAIAVSETYGQEVGVGGNIDWKQGYITTEKAGGTVKRKSGGGLGLALACDFRIGSNNAKMAASYSGMGLSPDGGTTWLLPRLVGVQISRKFFLENLIWSAQQSHDYGAIDELVDADNLISRSCEIARKCSSWGMHSKEATKHLLDVQSVNDFETHLKHESTLIEAAGTTDDFKEGVSAFLEKRKPNFD